MLQVYYIFRRVVLGVLFVAFSAIFGQWCINLAEKHHFFENPLAMLKPLADGMAYLQNLPGFWIAIATFSGLAVGMYLDAFMRRCAAQQPTVKRWLDPLDAMATFATDGEVRNARNNARERQDRLKLEYDATKRQLDALIGKPQFGSSDGIADPGPSSPEIDALRKRLSEFRTALTASGEPILKADREILEELISQLKRGALTAKGFRVQGDQIAEEPTIIPASHWLLLNFDTYDVKRQSVGGGGKNYKGLQIGLNENQR